MKYLLDTNILADAVLERDPFDIEARAILSASEEGSIDAFVPAHALPTLAYLVERHRKSLDPKAVLSDLLNQVRVVSINEILIQGAIESEIEDFEDALVDQCAQAQECVAIITRDRRGFSKAVTPAVFPNSLIDLLEELSRPPNDKLIKPMKSPFTSDQTLAELPERINPWEMFGLEESATVDGGALKRAYLDLSRKLHPDRFQAQGGEQLERAQDWSTALNDAYRTLKDTPSRLRALLERHGLMPAEGTQSEKTPQDLLMEVFELRETLEDLGDAAPNDAQRKSLQAMRDDFAERMKAIKGELEEHAKAWDDSVDTRAKTAQDMVEAFGHSSFFRRTLNELDKALTKS